MKIEEPFHEGELEVQNRLGLHTEAKQNSGVITDSIVKGAFRFIEQQRMAVLGSIDQDENIWASVLVGEAGFMQPATERLITFDLSKITGNEHDPPLRRLWPGGVVHCPPEPLDSADDGAIIG